MKVRNLVLGLLLATNVLTAQSAVYAPFSATHASSSKNTERVNIANAVSSAVINSQNNATVNMSNTVSSAVINSQNNATIDCILKYESVKKDDEFFGTSAPSLEKTVNNRRCQLNKNIIE